MLMAFSSSGGASDKIYVDDVFSAYTYHGNGNSGVSQTITNGIDLAGEGGLVWIKGRDIAVNHQIFDTARGTNNVIISNTTAADYDTLTSGGYGTLTDFNANGFTLAEDTSAGRWNHPAYNYASWTFRKAPKFFDVQTATLSSGNATVSFSDLSTLGMVIVKRTDSTGDWYVWHRSLTAGKLVYLNKTDAEATLGHITVSGTTLTLVDGTLADGNYVCYGFAHDTSTDGIIQCGSFTTDGSGNDATVNLGWEPQYILMKDTANANWFTFDSSRGLVAGGRAGSMFLVPNSAAAESGPSPIMVNATGFADVGFIASSKTVIYLAIRRPNKPPTSGTQVYNAIAWTGTGAAATVTGVGFAPDFVMSKVRANTTTPHATFDRLRGVSRVVFSQSTGAEEADTSLTSFNMDGISVRSDSYGYTNLSGEAMIHHFFRRAPGFFDIVCDTGTGSAHTIIHNLGAVPELMIRKKRSAADAWYVYAGDATDYLVLNTTAATADLDTIWNDTAPTTSVFTVGTHDDVNQSTGTFVTYLFATLAGISKVGTYTGNGGSADSAGTAQTVNCGFAAGSRFVMIKCTSNASDWVVMDTVRGIVSGNDPTLSLNTTAAEVTGRDLIDPDSGGFIINQLGSSAGTSANFNVTGRTYIYLSLA